MEIKSNRYINFRNHFRDQLGKIASIRASFQSKYFCDQPRGKSLSKNTISQFLCSRMYIVSIMQRWCSLPYYLPFSNADKKKKVKFWSRSKSIIEISYSKNWAKILNVFIGILQFQINPRSYTPILASLLSYLPRTAMYL